MQESAIRRLRESFLSVPQLSELSGTKEANVRTWVNHGIGGDRLPSMRLGKRIFVKLEDLEAWGRRVRARDLAPLENHEIPPEESEESKQAGAALERGGW